MHLEPRKFNDKVNSDNLFVFNSAFNNAEQAKAILERIKIFNKGKNVPYTCFRSKDVKEYGNIVWALATNLKKNPKNL